MKIPVGLLGATGLLGQHYVALLARHPWFELTFLGGSKECPYEEAVADRWHLADLLPKGLHVSPLSAIEKAKKSCSFVFSALPNEQAEIFEERYASSGLPVLSNASYGRKVADIPMLIPEINAHHLEVIAAQKKKRSWDRGFIVTKPNCAIQSFMIPLAPLHARFGIQKLHITTLQAISGAGIGGLSSMTIHDNVIPYIAGEEKKVENEPLKIFGTVKEGKIEPAAGMTIASAVNRVPVLNGHLACLSIGFTSQPTAEEIVEAWSTFSPLPSLPSAPKYPIVYRHEPARPQARLDCDAGNGMGITVGRLRSCPLLDFRFVGLCHNAVRGGAGGGILTAELLVSRGYIDGTP